MIAAKRTNQAALENFLLAHYERQLGAVRVRSTPFLLLLDPSSVCQLQCPMCPTGLENAKQVRHGRARYRKRGMMARELFDAILDELGGNLFFVHLYNWGEPLLNPELGYFIRQLSERGITTDTNTNLSLPLSDRAIDELAASGIDRIEASIDGFSQESYGRYRIKGRFELARDNLVRLARARDRLNSPLQLAWNYLVFRFNEHEIEAARAFCDDHGIEFVRREAAISEMMREEFLPTYRAGETLGGFFEHRQQAFDPAEIESRGKASCAWHYFYSVVNSDGSVSPCCAPWEDDWDFGTVEPGRRGFLEIWNNTRYRRARGDVSGHRLLAWLRGTGQLGLVRSNEDFVRLGTLCEGCLMPPSMMDLYSHRADLVVAHYEQNLAQQYPDLSEAFASVRRNPEKFAAIFARSLQAPYPASAHPWRS